jgi:hypothetical protein
MGAFFNFLCHFFPYIPKVFLEAAHKILFRAIQCLCQSLFIQKPYARKGHSLWAGGDHAKGAVHGKGYEIELALHGRHAAGIADDGRTGQGMGFYFSSYALWR